MSIAGLDQLKMAVPPAQVESPKAEVAVVFTTKASGLTRSSWSFPLIILPFDLFAQSTYVAEIDMLIEEVPQDPQAGIVYRKQEVKGRSDSKTQTRFFTMSRWLGDF